MIDSVFHITSLITWADAIKSGVYSNDSLKTEGFIHCSKANQILRVANAIYAQEYVLVILEIDPSRLKPELRWEAGSDKADELFPHIYGPLNMEAVINVFDFEQGINGDFQLPEGLESVYN